jgi:hypothetical protein
MDKNIKEIIHKYWKKKITIHQFKEKISNIIGNRKKDIRNFIEEIIKHKNPDHLEYGLVILFAFEENNEMIDLINQLILEPWHRSYEELVHNLQRRKRTESIPFLKKAIQNKYEYLEVTGTGTRQFINQCGHALRSIGTQEALDIIRQLSQSKDPIIKDEMLYRISKIEGRNDYQRKYD